MAILDADKEGFLRSETSLIQTIGRAARNAEGLVILYADTVTPSMRSAMDETDRRRKLQDDFNRAHGIVPRTIRKSVREMVEISHSAEEASQPRKKLTDRERAGDHRPSGKRDERGQPYAGVRVRRSAAGSDHRAAGPEIEKDHEQDDLVYLRDPQRRVLGLYRVFQPAADRGGYDAGQPGVRPELRDAAGADGGVRPVPQGRCSRIRLKHLPIFLVGAYQHPAAERGVFPVPDHVLAVGGGGAAVSGPVLRGAGQRRPLENTPDEGGRSRRCACRCWAASWSAASLAGDMTASWAGIGLGVVSGMCYASYTVFSHYGLAHYESYTMIYWTFLVAGLGSVFFADIRHCCRCSGSHRGIIGGICVVASWPRCCPYIFYTKGLEGVESGRASIITNIEPVVETLVGITVFHEALTVWTVLGVGCVIGCVALLARGGRHEREAAAE